MASGVEHPESINRAGVRAVSHETGTEVAPREDMSRSSLELVGSGPLRYLVSVPTTAARNAAPVLCFLHGYDEAAPMPIERALTLHGPLAPSAASAARDEFLVVAPQLPRAGDLWHRAADDVLAIVGEAARRFGGDPDRWILTGFSFGGNGVFDLAAAQADWCTLWAVDPTRVPPDALGDTPLWLSIGAAARGLTPLFVRTLGLERPGETRGPGAEPSRVFLDEGRDHTGSAASAYADARIYRWLHEQVSRASGGMPGRARA
jgi:poly(3-hydroxybutyrate) depolymerase